MAGALIATPDTASPEAKAGQTYQSLCKLPVFRPVALKLLKTLAGEEAEVREITALLAVDPSLSAEIMTLANSALYGLRNPVRTVGRAVTVLGMERMKSAALTVAMQSFTRRVPETDQSRDVWRHSLACAFVAEELAEAYGQSRDAGYMAGLMHDVGRFGLMAAFPASTTETWALVHASGAEVLEKERRQFGMDHAEAGACLSRVWGLPEEFRAVAARHHDDGAAEETTAVGLARAACLAADALGFEAARKSGVPPLEEVAAGLPGPIAGRLRRLSGKLRELVDERFRSVDSTLAA